MDRHRNRHPDDFSERPRNRGARPRPARRRVRESSKEFRKFAFLQSHQVGKEKSEHENSENEESEDEEREE